MRPVLMRDLVRKSFVDAFGKDLIDEGLRWIERLIRDVHRAGRRLAVAVGVDLNDVEFIERKRPQPDFVVFNEVAGETGELFRGTLVLEAIREDANRPRSALL